MLGNDQAFITFQLPRHCYIRQGNPRARPPSPGAYGLDADLVLQTHQNEVQLFLHRELLLFIGLVDFAIVLEG
ncbi:hypothetical protein D3C79_1021250 [compost metagenome]